MPDSNLVKVTFLPNPIPGAKYLHPPPSSPPDHTPPGNQTPPHQFSTFTFLADLGDPSPPSPSSCSHSRFLPPFLPLGVIGVAVPFFAFVGVDAFFSGDADPFSSPPPAALAGIPRTFAIRCITALGVTPMERWRCVSSIK